ncbi:MAG: SbcC/MukB-like Walker B domain-containing protein, partial [Bacteroidota bacterium]|nr:SbcC/MukB-like Walker B domain-containing protein [Bacteroidota bacterium]
CQNPPKSDNNKENIFSKIEIKPDSKDIFKTWIENQINSQYNCLCCNDIACLQNASKAVTKSGLIKRNKFYHEKDDTNYINKNNYILGWDNSEKISVLEKELEQLGIKLKKKQSEENEISKIITDLETKQKAIDNLLEISNFSEIDYQTIEKEILRLEERLEKLKNNKELELLKEKTKKLITEIKNLETEKTELTGQISTVKANIETDKTAIKDSEGLINTATKEEQEEFYSLIYPLVPETINHSNQISGTKNTIEQNLKKKKKKISEPYKTLQDSIVDAMSDFKYEFPDDMKQEELRNEIGFLDDFITLYNKLESENLTELKEKFDEKLRKRSDRVINDFWMNLERQKKNIENKTGNKGRINELLKKRNYQENKSFLQIIPKENKDDEIKNFIKEIKSCFYPIGGKHTPEERLKKNKEIFVNIKSLLEKLEKYNLPGERWVKKVTDVRNWFYFTASERDINNSAIEIKAHSGTASKSGGETFKITYTILASAIADEFGLVGNQIKTNSLRFIAVDEIFNNLGVQWSKYVLKMFEEMDLQLLIVSPDSLEKANIAKDHIKNV